MGRFFTVFFIWFNLICVVVNTGMLVFGVNDLTDMGTWLIPVNLGLAVLLYAQLRTFPHLQKTREDDSHGHG